MRTVLGGGGWTVGSGPIFLSGVGRSGTTLMQVMLDSHPDLAMGSESTMLPTDSISEARKKYQRALFRRAGIANDEQDAIIRGLPADANGRHVLAGLGVFLAKRKGAKWWGWKIMARNPAQYREAFPSARFVHMVRDPRDCYASQRQHSWGWKKASDSYREWLDVNAAAERVGARAVSYEDLVANTERELRRVCAFLGLEWDARMLAHHEQPHAFFESDEVVHPSRDAARQAVNAESVGRGLRELGAEDLAKFMEVER